MNATERHGRQPEAAGGLVRSFAPGSQPTACRLVRCRPAAGDRLASRGSGEARRCCGIACRGSDSAIALRRPEARGARHSPGSTTDRGALGRIPQDARCRCRLRPGRDRATSPRSTPRSRRWRTRFSGCCTKSRHDATGVLGPHLESVCPSYCRMRSNNRSPASQG